MGLEAEMLGEGEDVYLEDVERQSSYQRKEGETPLDK